MDPLPKIAFVASAASTVQAFLLAHFRRLNGHFDIDVYVNDPSGDHHELHLIRQFHIPLKRQPAIRSDLEALRKLYQFFRIKHYEIVQTVTPKAGLIGMLSARLARVPIRIHWMTGQVWVTKRGFARWYLRKLDQLTARLATHLLVDSYSQMTFLIQQRIVKESKMSVLKSGSICGVDFQKFRPDIEIRNEIRKSLDIDKDDLVLLFVGRLCNDKGVHDLLSMYTNLPEAILPHLILVGTDEEGIQSEWQSRLVSRRDSIHFIGHSDEPERYMAASDIFVIPSHREGFGLSVIEAAAVGIPSIGSDIYGLCDAIEDGNTGLLVPASDTDALGRAVCFLLLNATERLRLGRNARNRALTQFSSELLTQEYLDFLKKLLGK
jgi:glycosyltransferase involved in cell wall biosynthesis